VQVMLINKQGVDAPVRVSFENFEPKGHVVLVHDVHGKDADPWNCPDTNCAHYYFNGVMDAQLANDDPPPPQALQVVGSNIDETLPPLSVTVLDFRP
jgi:hypothetical protein